jgi:very-short-patch-repair endonuclease
MARKLKKKDLKRKMILDYKESNEKYSKLLKEIHLGNSISIEQSKLKYRSNIPKEYKQSRGETLVEKVLIKCKKYFLKEVEFKGCINKYTSKKLRFDFYLPKDNICIEFDGEQHYKSILEFDGNDGGKALNRRKDLDKIKDNFCKLNKIRLLRIKYDDKNKLSKISNFIKK